MSQKNRRLISSGPHKLMARYRVNRNGNSTEMARTDSRSPSATSLCLITIGLMHFLMKPILITLNVMNKKAKLDIEDNLDIGVPWVKSGRISRIKIGETVLAQGQYIEE